MSCRKFFMLFAACALIPLIAAQLSLSQGWFQQGSTNKGQWLEHEIQLLTEETLLSQGDKLTEVHWHLIYIQDDVCAEQCEQVLFTLQQLYSGMGRKQVKVRPSIMAHQQPAQLNSFPAIHWQPEPAEAAELKNQIVIVNQRGLVLLRYSVAANKERIKDIARDIRTDLMRLMNYDRSGA